MPRVVVRAFGLALTAVVFAVACGCDGVFLETHPNPDEAKSDGPNMIALDDFPALAETCLRLRQALAEPAGCAAP